MFSWYNWYEVENADMANQEYKEGKAAISVWLRDHDEHVKFEEEIKLLLSVFAD